MPTVSERWPQIVSDVSGMAQQLPSETIGASYDDAWLGGVAAGLLDLEDDWSTVASELEPDPRNRGAYDERYEAFKGLYPATRDVVHALATSARGS